MNDWRDVVSKKIDVPEAIFLAGDYSHTYASQQWANSVILTELYIYTKVEEGFDHS